MTPDEMATQIAGSFRAVSPAALKLVGLLDRSDFSTEEVVEVLKHDAVLTAKLLRVCNSPSLGFAEPVCSVEQAVLLLGYQEILRMVLSLAFNQALAVPMHGYAVEANELWRHSLVVGVASGIVAKAQSVLEVEPAIAFTAGLLHDIGKLAINQALTPETQTAVRHRIAQLGAARVQAEKEVLGTDHGEVGACLLTQWRLPAEIVEGVANHHAPPFKPCCRLSALVCIANSLAHLAGSAPGWEAYALHFQNEVALAFELTPQKIELLVIQVREAAQQAESLLMN